MTLASLLSLIFVLIVAKYLLFLQLLYPLLSVYMHTLTCIIIFHYLLLLFPLNSIFFLLCSDAFSVLISKIKQLFLQQKFKHPIIPTISKFRKSAEMRLVTIYFEDSSREQNFPNKIEALACTISLLIQR